MAPRDNTDQLEVVAIEGSDPNFWWPLDINWRRKDKLREIFIEGEELKVIYEDVVWPEHPVKGFASLYIVINGVAQVLADMFYDDRDWVRIVEVGPGEANEYALSIPIDSELLPPPGEEFGLVFAQPTVRSSVKKYVMPGEIAVEPNPEAVGKPWPCFKDGHAPVLAMAPTGEQPNDVWGNWLDNIHPNLIQMGVDGFHCPMQGKWRPHFYEILIKRNAKAGLVTAWWLDEEMGGGPTRANEQLQNIIRMYDSIDNPGWQIIGPTYDVWQASGWEDVDTVNEWIEQAQQKIGSRRILIGARARRSPETGNPDQQYIGDYRAFEAHINTGEEASSVFTRAVQEAGDKPVAEFDRFRVRHGGEGKDMVLADIPLVCQASRRHRVAIIIGVADARGNVSDVGSGVFPNASAIQSALGIEVLPEEPVPSPPPASDRLIVDIDDLESFRVAAVPGEDSESKWNKASHWAPTNPEITVTKVNDTNNTFICYGIGIFIGMEADKQEEITIEPRVIAKDQTAGRLLPAKIEEKDSPGMAFDAHDFHALPVFIRIRPGDKLSGLFQHTVIGKEGQEYSHQAHGHITFYCYKES